MYIDPKSGNEFNHSTFPIGSNLSVILSIFSIPYSNSKIMSFWVVKPVCTVLFHIHYECCIKMCMWLCLFLLLLILLLGYCYCIVYLFVIAPLRLCNIFLLKLFLNTVYCLVVYLDWTSFVSYACIGLYSRCSKENLDTDATKIQVNWAISMYL